MRLESDVVNKEKLDAAYTQRAIASVLFAKMAERLGYTVGIGKDDNVDWEDEWRTVLYVDLPEGQISWHFAPKDKELLEGFKEYTGKWDGTFRGRDTVFAKALKSVIPYSEDIPEYGDLMTVEEFIDCCECGGFIDYDGYGRAVANDKIIDIDVIYPSERDKIPKAATHIVWFNR